MIAKGDNMTIKEKFNARIARVKDYAKQISVCRDLKRIVDEKRKDITVVIDADKEQETHSCMKVCFADLTDVVASDYDYDTKTYTYVKNCFWFNKKPCPMCSCRYNIKNRQYIDKQMALQEAKVNKKVLFNKIFQRIR